MLWSLPTIIIEIAQHSERRQYFYYESNLFCWKCEEICFNVFVSYLSFTNILLKSAIIQVVKNLAFMFLKISSRLNEVFSLISVFSVIWQVGWDS